LKEPLEKASIRHKRRMALKETDNKNLVSIGLAAKQAGVSRQSVQYYLMIGLLEPTQTSSTGRRLFDEKTIAKIRLIRELNNNGYPLRAIRDLFQEKLINRKGPVQ
jgi:DNA-binding transcriptional MerR regulator